MTSSNQFTERELAILEKVCEGWTNRKIARALKISEPTLKSVLHGVYARTPVKDRPSLILYLFTLDKRPPDINGHER